MRIAIDLRPLQIGHEHRGIGAYLINILSRIPPAAEHHFIFYQFDVSNPLDDFHIPKPASYEILKIPKPVWRKSPLSLMKYVYAGLFPRFPKLNASQHDVFLQPDFQLGLPKARGCKKIVVMYDLIPLILPEYYMPSWRKSLSDKSLSLPSRFSDAAKKWYHQKRYLKNLKRLEYADKILSISESTTDDTHKYLGIDKKKIITIPLAPSFRTSGDQKLVRKEVKTKIGKIKRPHLTYIGGTDARRKIDELVYAFDLINSQGLEIDLVFAGNELKKIEDLPNVNARNAILSSPYKSRIHLLGFVSDAEKEFILRNSAAFVYPTLYEGFGLPILEAMQAGCPVVAYKNSSIPEIGGKAIAYTASEDAAGICEATLRVLSNKEFASKLAKEGRSQSQKFSWDITAENTWRTIFAA